MEKKEKKIKTLVLQRTVSIESKVNPQWAIILANRIQYGTDTQNI